MLSDAAGRAHRRFLFGLALLTLFAWLLREYFVLATVVEAPIRGDVRDYVAYAWNLLHHGVFSKAWPTDTAAVPTPDGFRGPGYPLFIAAAMALKSRPDDWYALLLHAQALLGALTVTGTVLLARRWLASGWALLAGVLLALWPHHIAATGALLSEVVLGATLVFALLCTAHAFDRPGARRWILAAGALFGYAWLVNPLVLFLPFALAALLWRGQRGHAAAWLLAVFLLPVAAWGIRGSTLADGGSGDRAKVNLVQGAWPQYHAAWNTSSRNPISRRIMQAIDREERLLKADTVAGLREIGTRMGEDPGYYARWYLLQKPWLLWDWDIRVGAGGVYFHRVSHSPLDTHPILRASTGLLHRLNPLLFALSLMASLALVVGAWRRRPWAPPAATIAALLFLYVTAMHALLQAEPRYSIPYRPFELLLATGALAAIAGAARRRWPARISSASASTAASAPSSTPMSASDVPAPTGMTRWRAAGIHLLISLLVLSLAAALAIALWYPPSLFHVSGVDRLLLLLAAIDLTVGPLLTLLVYRHGKRGMRFDLTVIALLQAAFFAYGAHVFFQSRPVFLVGNVDRFELVFANQIAPADWARARPPYNHPGYGRPRLVGVAMPTEPQARNALLFEELSGHLAVQQPRLYRDYAAVAPQLHRRAHSLDAALRSSPLAKARLQAALRRLDLPAAAVRWLPLDSSRGSAVQLVAAADARPLATVALDPWTLLAATGQPGHPSRSDARRH
ncbi:TfpX/TfpZ family type IV pilin accessory protein [Cognatiluteimonas weifangensis]|uniref:Glycosyltransferase RgtA/B/C/D-like domain-containing protein n=1 Tax=Cognatiluteimonas weifangensis TaxID=2303539 RepID=A0A372DSJ2_9GAMM|nr:TfpX/TfpZ family type IV pilin accessory protein [Luteimonas weifangensis]RFP62533.1 hypothetical protein D0Y53_01590 [Luteimonas weifangensis]